MKVLLSIKPEFADKIFNGSKGYEYRKVPFKRANVKTVVVYSTFPVGRLIGEFEIVDVVCDDPENIWALTQERSGIDLEFFTDYYSGRDTAVAIKIGETTLYETPLDPLEVFNDFVAPQSFRYLTDALVCSLPA